jgi:hypothetical protein
MTHEQAIEKCRDYLYLIDRHFLNSNDEKETIKAVVAWDEGDGNWQPHVCFYDWPETTQGRITHMPVEKFLSSFQLLKSER